MIGDCTVSTDGNEPFCFVGMIAGTGSLFLTGVSGGKGLFVTVAGGIFAVGGAMGFSTTGTD